MVKRIPLTEEQHEFLGKLLNTMRTQLVQLGVDLSNRHLPKAHPVISYIRQAEKRLLLASNDLDNLLFRQHPEHSDTPYFGNADEVTRLPGANGQEDN